MKLYTYFRSSASYRVRIALALKGIKYNPVSISLRDGGHRTDFFRSVNPQRRVPAAELDGGAMLTQSLAMIDYLDETHPEPPLLPKDSLERARVRAVAQVICCDIHPLNNVGARNRLKQQFGADERALDTWTAHWIHDGFAAVEKMIEPGPYAFGDAITLADVCIVPQVYNARRYHVPLSDFPRIVAVDASARQHPAFAAAAPDVQPDATA